MKKNLMNEKDFRTIEYKNFDLAQNKNAKKEIKIVKSIKMKKTSQKK